MFWKIIFRQMNQKRAMTLTLFTLIALLVSLFVYIQNTNHFANRSIQLIMKNMGLNQVFIPANENPLAVYLCQDHQTRFPESVAESLAQSTELLSKYYVALLQERMAVNGSNVIISGIRPLKRPDETAEKASMVKPVQAGTARVGSVAAERLGCHPGEKLTIKGRAFQVSQILPERGTLDDCRVYLPLAAAQDLLNAEGQIHAVLSFECLHVGGTLAHIHGFQKDKLAELFPAYRQFNIASVAEGRFYARRMTKNYLSCLSVIITLIAVLVIAICGFQDVSARKFETGVLISMGADYRYICGLYLVKILLISALASLTGFLIGGHLAVWLNTPFLISNTRQITIMWSHLPPTVLAGMAVALLGQLLPTLQLLQMDPHTILSED